MCCSIKQWYEETVSLETRGVHNHWSERKDALVGVSKTTNAVIFKTTRFVALKHLIAFQNHSVNFVSKQAQ